MARWWSADLAAKRIFLSACSDELSDSQFNVLAADLEKDALAKRMFESAAGFLSIASPDDLATEDFAIHYLQSKIPTFKMDSDLADPDTQFSLRFALESSFSQIVMPAHLRVNQGPARYLMTALLTSWSGEAYLERGPGRGSEPILKSFVDNLERVDINDLPLILTDFTHYWFTQMLKGTFGFNANAMTTIVRVLNEVRARPALASIAPVLDSLEAEVLAKLDTMPGAYGKDFDQDATFGEVYQNRAYLFSFFDRHISELLTIKTESHPELRSEIKIEYWVEKATSDDVLFLSRVQNRIGKTNAWFGCSAQLQIELPAILDHVLLTADNTQTALWIGHLDMTMPSNAKVIDDLIYEIAIALDQVQTKRDLSNSRSPSRLEPTTLAQMQLLQIILVNPDVMTAMTNSSSFGLSRLRSFKVSETFSERPAFPKSFINFLETI